MIHQTLNRLATCLVLAPVRLYQWCISPLLGPRCRFYPSCSRYCCDAVETYGVIKGGYLSIKRCLKCHPWHPGGLDPVPKAETGDSAPPFTSRELQRDEF